MEDRPGNRVCFGPFEADFRARELRKSGRPVRLQDQPFRILQILLRRPGEVVTREELRQRLWAEDVDVDFDRSLNTSVARLREALADSPTRPEYIETVPRQGYRFIATPHAGGPPLEQSPSAPGGSQWARRLGPIAVLIGCVFLVAWAGPKLVSNFPPALQEGWVAERLTYYEGIESEADFSPDGAQVVFTWDGPNQDNFDLFIRTITGTEPRRLTSHPAQDFSPAWSPDGQWIAFLRSTGDGQAALYCIPALGGREQLLLPASGAGMLVYPFLWDIRYVEWSPDSSSLILSRTGTSGEGISLFVFDRGSGSLRRLTTAPADVADFSPALSPDGRRLCFSRQQGGETRLYWLPLGVDLQPDGDPQPLTPRRRFFGSAVWMSNDEIVSSTGVYRPQLWRIPFEDPSGMHRMPLTGPEGRLPALSRSSRRLVYTSGGLAAPMDRLTLDDPAAPPVRLVSSTGYNSDFEYSPDGEWIAFNSNRTGEGRVWVSRADGSRQAMLWDRQAGSARWSPDGSRIAVNAGSERGDFDIVLLRPGGGAAEVLTPGPEDDRVPNWSGDGEWVYFASDRGAGYQLWKKEVGGGGREVRVTQDGGFHAIESPDGEFV